MSLRKNGQETAAEIAKKSAKPVEEVSRDIKDEDDSREELLVDTDDEKKLVDEINEKRLTYKKYADKQKKINYIITGVVCVALIACFVLMMVFSSIDWVLYVGVGVMGVVLLATYLSSRFMRKNLLAQAEVYIGHLYTIVSKYIYGDFKCKDFVSTPKGSLEDKYFIDAHFYKALKGTKSRNFVHFVLDGNEYDSCDLAANQVIKGKLSPKFLGRFYSVKAPLKTSGKITLFQLKGGKLSVPVDDIDSLKLVEGNNKYVIYTDDENYKSIFTDRLVKALSSFGNVSPHIDIIFSIHDNLISFGIDYEDEFLNIPVDNEFAIKNSRLAKSDFEKFKKIIDILIDNNKLNIKITENKETKIK